MGELVHISKFKVYKEPGKGKVKQAYLEGFPKPIRMGVHGGIKKFYGVEPEEDLPATLDHVVAGGGGGMKGGPAGAPGGRAIPARPPKRFLGGERDIQKKERKTVVAPPPLQ